ncbi:MAG: RHS domain-containing protein, partial [Nitrospirae bacterium]|nr:RHS domain-containing protein [Nitrospirota bacterium]
GNIKVEYIYLSDRPLVKIDIGSTSEEPYYYHTDHLGTPLFMTDSTGQKVWSAELLPFGEGYDINEDVDGDQVNIVNNLRSPGQYYDAETGLHYNMARDYHPQVGRYTQSDPIGLAGGINTFVYAGGNPVYWKDPSGLLWIYEQSTGNLYHQPDTRGGVPPELVGTGYAGHKEGLNNPNYQNVRGTGPSSNAGPLPQGNYIIGPQKDNEIELGKVLPGSMRMIPDPNNKMFGRYGFLIHGGNMKNKTSSQGCIVMSPSVRDKIGRSGDTNLTVIP